MNKTLLWHDAFYKGLAAVAAIFDVVLQCATTLGIDEGNLSQSLTLALLSALVMALAALVEAFAPSWEELESIFDFARVMQMVSVITALFALLLALVLLTLVGYGLPNDSNQSLFAYGCLLLVVLMLPSDLCAVAVFWASLVSLGGFDRLFNGRSLEKHDGREAKSIVRGSNGSSVSTTAGEDDR